MKKKLALLLVSPLLFTSLTACQVEKSVLTYGTYLETNINQLEKISNFDLYWRAETFKETFILATYQSEYSEDCLCWSTFQNVITNYINTYHEKVYLFDTSNEDIALKNYQIDGYKDSTPALYIFKGKKQLAKFTYKKDGDKAIFNDTTAEAMYTRVHKVINKPVIYEVDDAFLDKSLKEKDQSVTLFVRAGCSDCLYALPNVLIPYINKHNINKEIWYFDLQNYYDLAKKEDASEEEKAQYPAIKNKYELSENSNQTYGYLEGVVPTIQYREKGVLKDAAVCFNDVVSEKEDGSFYISNSFYTEERIPNLKYYNGKPLKDMVIQGGLKTPTGYCYWNQDDAIKVHQPIFEAFLNYYL